MIFEEEMVDNKIIPEMNYVINQNRAARAVIIKNNKILLMKVDDRAYKLPGGRISDNETFLEGLLRQVKEETGYTDCIIKSYVGRILQKDIDKFDSKTIFEMESKYYLCEVYGLREDLSLSVEEKLDRMHPVWMDLDDAIEHNEEYFCHSQDKSWISRENISLRLIEKNIICG